MKLRHLPVVLTDEMVKVVETACQQQTDEMKQAMKRTSQQQTDETKETLRETSHQQTDTLTEAVKEVNQQQTDGLQAYLADTVEKMLTGNYYIMGYRFYIIGGTECSNQRTYMTKCMLPNQVCVQQLEIICASIIPN